MLVLSSPSGAGKTTIARELLARVPDLNMSVSATTRAPRPGEIDGQDYYFISDEKFNEMVENNEFLEHAMVFGNSYGTPSAPVFETLKQGKDVLFDVDWQGTQQLHGRAGDDVVRLFILPPSHDELEDRLRGRKLDSEEVISSRMAKAANEMAHYEEYDYIVINSKLEDSVQEVQMVLRAEHLRKSRRKGLYEFVRGLCDEENS